MTDARISPQEERASIRELLELLCFGHGIAPVPKIEWSKRMKRLLGRAYVDRHVIRLSAWLDSEQAEDTLRHELAHIATGGSGRKPHDSRWREWATRLGAVPRATSPCPPALAPEPRQKRRYTGLECPGCGKRFVRARVLRGLYCRSCGPNSGILVKAMHGDRAALNTWANGSPVRILETL